MAIAIISVRGNSVGIKDKNIISFCGKPLICHTIEKTLKVKGIDRLYVSSDSDKILDIIVDYFSSSISFSKIDDNYHKLIIPDLIKQPDEISTNQSTSVDAWKYVLSCINKKIDFVVAVQNTSPLCETSDIQRGINDFTDMYPFDSLFSAAEVRDMFIWQRDSVFGRLKSVTYDYHNRKLRQNIPVQYLETGAFYIFKPEMLLRNNNMLGGYIGVSIMELWKMFEINELKDISICEDLYKKYILKEGV